MGSTITCYVLTLLVLSLLAHFKQLWSDLSEVGVNTNSLAVVGDSSDTAKKNKKSRHAREKGDHSYYQTAE